MNVYHYLWLARESRKHILKVKVNVCKCTLYKCKGILGELYISNEGSVEH